MGDSHLPMSLMVHPSGKSTATSRELGPVSESGEISRLQQTSRQPHELHGTSDPLQAKVHFLDVWMFDDLRIVGWVKHGQTVGPHRAQRHLESWICFPTINRIVAKDMLCHFSAIWVVCVVPCPSRGGIETRLASLYSFLCAVNIHKEVFLKWGRPKSPNIRPFQH